MSVTPAMIPPEITLIVAATTRHMGIGKSGTLPWTGLKQEMAYFARVTKRVPTVEVKLPRHGIMRASEMRPSPVTHPPQHGRRVERR